jgi:RNA polymerase sigma-54 factor
MALAARLQLRQSQSLVMTPQLMQSIRLLQLTHVELDRFIDDEIERNPLLERAPDTAEPEIEAVAEAAASPETSDWFESELQWSAEEISGKLGASLENLFPDDPGSREPLAPEFSSLWKSNVSGGAPEGFDLEDVTAAPVTLRDHIEQQIAFAFTNPADAALARELAEGLDEAGYIRLDLDELAIRLGTDGRTVRAVLAICQRFEPTGLFARDLAECLALQLAARDRYDPAMQAMIANLDLLARRDFAALKRLCGVDEEDLIDMLAEIRGLDPKPGAEFAGGTADTIVADVVVRTAADGSWLVELNADALPRVLVDQAYYARVSARAASREDREFLSECLQSANWLTRSLDQRARTILKVASEIVRRQDAFLVNGIRHLRPLNLRTVAEAIGMHESTVSRVTTNKYIATPRGIFELRFFFTAALASSEGGEAHSAEAVRDRIRQLVEEETPQEVLSDDAIVDILKESGVDIARRTVAKYREGMNIPSSVQRRREKRAISMANA